ncbi:MAG TPA: hypothetical protein VG963_02455, partial [Polyangiaceae bacterium]|nr:hypothetical protein [Polyangiaceae bacterium]
MARFNVLAWLCAISLFAGCGSKTGGATSDPQDNSDDDAEGAGDAGKNAGKKDGGGSSSSQGGSSSDTSSGSGGKNSSGGTSSGSGKPPIQAGATNFTKDTTGGSGVSADVIDKLRQGGTSCSANVLYPYADTVFPAGLTPPTIMWAGAADAAYLKLAYDRLDTVSYEFAVGSSNPGELAIPADDWAEVTARSRNTPLLVTLTTKSGSTLSTCQWQWRIAQGEMSGSVFYNTYNLPEEDGLGAVMRLTFGEPKAEIYLSYPGQGTPGVGPCVSCHSVSFDGSMLAASQHDYTPVLQSFSAASYTVSAQPQPAVTAQLPEATFGAFTPDGTRMLTMGNPDCTVGADSFPRSPNNFPLVVGPSKAQLIDTKSGSPVQASGLQDDWYMWMPQFSPKGDMVVFNHAKPGSNGTDRRELAIMDFDAATNTFSNL